MIAKNAELRGFLANETFTLETSIVASLKEMEEEMVHLGGKIEAARAEKRELLSDVVDMERQIMLWERKIALEKETQVGGGAGGSARHGMIWNFEGAFQSRSVSGWAVC